MMMAITIDDATADHPLAQAPASACDATSTFVSVLSLLLLNHPLHLCSLVNKSEHKCREFCNNSRDKSGGSIRGRGGCLSRKMSRSINGYDSHHHH
nr:hypothetical protein [Tanacetum cinerariifolium]